METNGEHNSVLFVGKKKSGKSTGLKTIVDLHVNEFQDMRFVVWDSTREWIERPRVTVLKSHEYSCEQAAAIALEMGDCVFVVDEIDRVCPNHSGGLKNGTALHSIVNCGRHYNVALLCAARRTCRVHKDITANIDVIFLFRHIDPGDLAWIEDVCGEDYAVACKRLEPQEFIRVEP